MKIAMIGPVYPYKGGIAQYTGAMVNNLLKEHDVKVFSFKMQYPRILYKREQKDFNNKTFEAQTEVDYSINTINPLTWFTTAKRIKIFNPTLIICQWWHPWFAPFYFALCKMLKRTKIIFVCHNVLPHEGFPLKRLLTKMVLSSGNGFILHSSQDESDLKSLVSNPKLIHAVHPAYNQFKIRNITKEEARNELNIPSDQEMMLFFGFVREYKGLKHLIRALPAICKERPHSHLWIVGEFWDGDKDEYLKLIASTGCQERVTLVDGYLPDDKVEPYFAAADVCVLPYESATQSGVIQVSYSFGCPVIATNGGGLPEVVIDNKTGFIVPPCNSEALSAAVISFFSKDCATDFSLGISEEAYKYSWDRMNEHITAL